MNDDRRLMLAVALSLAIYLGWSFFLMKTHPPKPPPPRAPVAESTARPAEMPVPTSPSVVPKEKERTPSRPEQLVSLDTAEIHLVFSTRGATLVHAVLQKPQYRRRVDGRDEPVDLVRGEETGRALLAEYQGASWPDDPLGDYEAKQEPSAVVFERRSAGVVLTRRYEVVAPYLLSMTASVSGGSARSLEIGFGSSQPPGASAPSGGLFGRLARSYPNVATAICRVDGKNESSASNKDAEVTLPAPPKLGTVEFGGVDERFFVGAMAPQDDRTGSCRVKSTAGGAVAATVDLPLGAAPSPSRTFAVFLGPKDLDLLQRASVLPGSKVDSELSSTVGFGFWTALCVPMLRVMELFHRALPNWGISILLLTLMIRLLLFPLQQAQYRSMEKMRVLQPKLNELKKKFGEDKERLNLETMKLYTENKVNPLGGCVPMLVQMPIWFALYRLLGTTIQLYREPFIPGWIGDLTSPDSYYVLPILMGATMVGTQLLSPQMPDSGQQRLMMWMMPVVMTVFFLNLPSGLNLYIVASNLLNIAQQYFVRRRTRSAPPSDRITKAGA